MNRAAIEVKKGVYRRIFKETAINSEVLTYQKKIEKVLISNIKLETWRGQNLELKTSNHTSSCEVRRNFFFLLARVNIFEKKVEEFKQKDQRIKNHEKDKE